MNNANRNTVINNNNQALVKSLACPIEPTNFQLNKHWLVIFEYLPSRWKYVGGGYMDYMDPDVLCPEKTD